MTIASITAWQDALRLCLRQSLWEKRYNTPQDASSFQRMAYAIKRCLNKAPLKKASSEELACRYVKLFNEQYGLGRRTEFEDGKTIHMVLRYQVEDRMPVLTITYYDGNTAHVERKRFNQSGTYVEAGPAYPVSEIAVTGLPESLPEAAQKTAREFKRHLMDIAEVLRSTTGSL